MDDYASSPLTPQFESRFRKSKPKQGKPKRWFFPHIDVLVDFTAGHGMLSFMDAFSWYKQIFMAEEDREKTAFTTISGRRARSVTRWCPLV